LKISEDALDRGLDHVQRGCTARIREAALHETDSRGVAQNEFIEKSSNRE
jgi:hypothetical protein